MKHQSLLIVVKSEKGTILALMQKLVNLLIWSKPVSLIQLKLHVLHCKMRLLFLDCLLTTEAIVCEIPEDKKESAHHHKGGMPDMY